MVTRRVEAVIGGVCCVVLGAGCVAWMPGGQLREGLGGDAEFRWTKDDDLTVITHGAPEQHWTMIQGTLVAVKDADGRLTIDPTSSKIETFFQSSPNVKPAADAMTVALSASTSQVEILARTLNEVISALLPLIAQGGAVQPLATGKDNP